MESLRRSFKAKLHQPALRRHQYDENRQEIYGVQLKQNYYSNNYNDGYLTR